jgi:hypothetical protein
MTGRAVQCAVGTGVWRFDLRIAGVLYLGCAVQGSGGFVGNGALHCGAALHAKIGATLVARLGAMAARERQIRVCISHDAEADRFVDVESGEGALVEIIRALPPTAASRRPA